LKIDGTVIEETRMSRRILATTLAFSLIGGCFALAQSTATAPDNSAGTSTTPIPKPGLGATSSDSGNLGTGASSADIGTGTEKGAMSPSVPAAQGQGATGADPNHEATGTP